MLQFSWFQLRGALGILCLSFMIPLFPLETGHATVVLRQAGEVEAVVYELMAVGTDGGADIPAASLAWWPRAFARAICWVWSYVLGTIFVRCSRSCGGLCVAVVFRAEGLPADVRVVWNGRLPISCTGCAG